MQDCDLRGVIKFGTTRLAQMHARMLTINGNDKDRNSNLTFVDFLEALGRGLHSSTAVSVTQAHPAHLLIAHNTPSTPPQPPPKYPLFHKRCLR